MIAALLRNLLKYAGVNAFLSGVRPCVVAMILATALIMGLNALFGFTAVGGGFSIDGRALIVFLLLWGVHFLWRKTRGRNPSPIAMIALSAALGIVLWSF